MKPEAQSTHLNPEQSSVHERPNIERADNSGNLESGVEISAENYEQKAETNSIIADVATTTILPTPVIKDTVVVDTTIGDTPLVANDDDLIEKEWVDKAKKIVAETQNNPYGRDEAVNKLQVDYLKKRYRRELGAAE
ncbi:MAG TPA: hypothetical protein VFD55_00180 [Candidatus Angelobacter sp.]|nr:hypothetical protein [Candidatus Angelobacter sp.]